MLERGLIDLLKVIDALDLLRRLGDNVCREQVDSAELISFAPNLPSTTSVLVEVREFVEAGQLSVRHPSGESRARVGRERRRAPSYRSTDRAAIRRVIGSSSSHTCHKGWSPDLLSKPSPCESTLIVSQEDKD